MIDGANHHVRRRRHLLGENFDARRFQRFLYKGIGTPKAGTIPPTTIVRRAFNR